MSLTVTFSKSDSEQLNYNTGTGLYEKLNADGSPMTDADNGQQAAFTNVFVLYASSGIKDDGYTRQYDMTGGTGLYLHGGAWEQISWSKEDATGPFSLTAADGTPLTVAPGKSFIAIWGGYYGQALRLTAADGSEQTLPEKPALLASGVTDEAAAAAEAALSNAQKLIDAQAAIDQANASLAEAQTELQDAQAALDADSENADLLAARDAAQAKIDELNQTIADNQAYLDANAPQPEKPRAGGNRSPGRMMKVSGSRPHPRSRPLQRLPPCRGRACPARSLPIAARTPSIIGPGMPGPYRPIQKAPAQPRAGAFYIPLFRISSVPSLQRRNKTSVSP
ncbi:DUF3048 C-terminal domain-containing protein [Gemmiger formicilis]|nr:DUF3048 C-terminal domain-containing protein [Gemmiger formicilis]